MKKILKTYGFSKDEIKELKKSIFYNGLRNTYNTFSKDKDNDEKKYLLLEVLDIDKDFISKIEMIENVKEKSFIINDSFDTLDLLINELYSLFSNDEYNELLHDYLDVLIGNNDTRIRLINRFYEYLNYYDNLLNYLRSFEKKVVIVVHGLESPAKVRSLLGRIDTFTNVLVELMFGKTKDGSPFFLIDFLSNGRIYNPFGIIQNTYPQVVYAIVNFYLYFLSKIKEKENLFKVNITTYISGYFDKSNIYLNNFIAYSESFGISLEIFLNFFNETFNLCFPESRLEDEFVYGLTPLELAIYWYIAIFLNRSYISPDCCKALLETNNDEYRVNLNKVLMVIYEECFEDGEFKPNDVLKDFSMFHFGYDKFFNLNENRNAVFVKGYLDGLFTY